MDIKKLNVTNVILTGILAALIFLCIDQRQSIKSTQQKQDDLYALTKSHFGHVWSEDLKENGRRLAFAKRFREVGLGVIESPEAIDAYLEFNGREVVEAMKFYITTNPLHGFQMAITRNPLLSKVNGSVDDISNLKKEVKSE